MDNMTLDEAIIHCEEIADRCDVTDGNVKCANEHRQLAEWLKDYKRLLKESEKVKKININEKLKLEWDL